MASDNVKFGFVEFAEKWNGRMAMLGFTIGLATEAVTGSGILQQLGFNLRCRATSPMSFRLVQPKPAPVPPVPADADVCLDIQASPQDTK
eukprot:g4116.t1